MTETAQFVWEQTFEQGFQRFAEETGKSLHEFMEFEVMRVLIETCYHWTPPPTKGNRGARGGRKGGKIMIAHSVLHIVAIREQEYIDHLQQRFGSNIIAAGKIRSGSSDTFQNVVLNPEGSLQRLELYHNSHRRNTGRTYGRQPHFDRGNQDVHDRMMITAQTYIRYVRQAQQRVGKLKDGWGPALSAVRSSQPAGWVKRAGATSGLSGQASGSYANQLVGFTGSLTATNQTAYFRDLDGFMRRAHSYTESFFNGPRFDRWLQQAIDRNRSVQTSKGQK